MPVCVGRWGDGKTTALNAAVIFWNFSVWMQNMGKLSIGPPEYAERRSNNLAMIYHEEALGGMRMQSRFTMRRCRSAGACWGRITPKRRLA